MSRLTTCGLTFLLAFAPPALAVDGVVLINQSTSVNGLPGCPNVAGSLITVCQSGSYRLSGNLTVPDANTIAIQITVDNVTIDLNGFSLLGPGGASGSGFGIFSQNFNSFITVSNGTIRGFGSDGIFLAGGVGIRIEGVTAVFNVRDGIGAGEGMVTLCHANSNGGAGIVGVGTLSNSSALSNNGDGIVWTGSATGNYSSGNRGNGFSGAGTFMANTAISNTLAGIVTFNPSVIMSNTLLLNGTKITAPNGSVVLNNATP